MDNIIFKTLFNNRLILSLYFIVIFFFLYHPIIQLFFFPVRFFIYILIFLPLFYKTNKINKYNQNFLSLLLITNIFFESVYYLGLLEKLTLNSFNNEFINLVYINIIFSYGFLSKILTFVIMTSIVFLSNRFDPELN